ncbi:glycosyltransferase family 4 protein, partial [Patescibacteria group bacterium]|nr:glycosyltransferase family 4 protein [Patescibacteria group bacterium]
IYSHWKVESKSSVISEGVNDNFYRRSVNEIENVKRRYGLHKPFFLYVGNAKEHKNVQTLIDAFQSLGDNSIDLVLITSGPETAFLNFQQGIKFIPDIPDSDLPALYSGAKAFVTASLYEGFCLPVAEAISCGCPVIASNKGAIPEIAGEDSVLVEPIAVELSKAMKNPPDPTDEVIHNKFSWNQAARDTINLLINI